MADRPAARREADERFGRPITPEEALLHPPDALLRQLGLPVKLRFPLGFHEPAPPRQPAPLAGLARLRG